MLAVLIPAPVGQPGRGPTRVHPAPGAGAGATETGQEGGAGARVEESGRDREAIGVARELTRRFPRSPWAPASHVFIGEHLFDAAKLDGALKEYRAAAEAPYDDVYPYALYKAAWCRFNQGAFTDAMKLFKRVVDISEKSGDVNKVQLAREARRDYVLAYSRLGRPDPRGRSSSGNSAPNPG